MCPPPDIVASDTAFLSAIPVDPFSGLVSSDKIFIKFSSLANSRYSSPDLVIPDRAYFSSTSLSNLRHSQSGIITSHMVSYPLTLSLVYKFPRLVMLSLTYLMKYYKFRIQSLFTLLFHPSTHFTRKIISSTHIIIFTIIEKDPGNKEGGALLLPVTNRKKS